MTEKITKIIKKIINSPWFVIIIGLLILAKTMLFYHVTIEQSGKIPISTFFGTLSFIAVIVCILCTLPNRMRAIGTIIIDVITSIILFINNIYYIYSSGILSIAQITNLQYSEQIMGALPSLVRLYQILYFIDFIILLILFSIKGVKIEKLNKPNKKVRIARGITAITTVIIIAVGCAPAIAKGNEQSYNKHMLIKNCTIYGYYIYDIKNAIQKNSNSKYKDKQTMMVDYEKLMADYNERYGKEQYNLAGALEGKNVIIVQLESLQNFLINSEINGKEITPNLNKFLEENIRFTNMHMQSYTTTADSEHSVVTSVYPVENGMAYTKYYTNNYDDIFELFHKKGYLTSYMHGNEPEFWNRGNVYQLLEVDDLALKDKFDDYEYINGFLSDELLYTQGVERLKQYEQPFFSFIVAASSHNPYELEGLEDRSKVSIDVGEKYKGTILGNYLEAANYADYAFGVFLDQLKESGLYDDTSILVFGDHNGLSMEEENMLEFIKGENDLTDVEKQLNFSNVLCGLKIPGVNNMTIDKPVSKLDVKPTFAYLCGIEDGFSLGTNMFASKDFICINNERIITDKYYYADNWYEIETGQAIDMEESSQELVNLLNKYYENMKTELDISNSIVGGNLLR